jgi:hypothetical protein
MSSIARRLGVMGQVDADVLSWRDTIIAAGGSVSVAILSIASRFVVDEKAGGAWALTDDYWPFWGENLIQATVSLKQRRTVTLVNAPVFTARRHFATDGTSRYLNTGFIPATHSVAATTQNTRLAIYLRENLSGNLYAAGASSSSNRTLRVRPRNASVAYLDVNSSSGTYTLPAATSAGYTAGSRDAASGANSYAYKNGVAMVQAVAPTAFGSASLPIVPILVGGYNNAGVFTSPRATSIGFMTVGATLSAAQELAQYNAVQAWATAVGANV